MLMTFSWCDPVVYASLLSLNQDNLITFCFCWKFSPSSLSRSEMTMSLVCNWIFRSSNSDAIWTKEVALQQKDSDKERERMIDDKEELQGKKQVKVNPKNVTRSSTDIFTSTISSVLNMLKRFVIEIYRGESLIIII